VSASVSPLKNWFDAVRADARRHLSTWDQSSGLGALMRLTFLCPGFQLALSIRLQTALHFIPFIGVVLRRILWYLTTVWLGSDIDPAARFGPGIYFPHPTGIVIGGEWEIGSNVSILQSVTLGRKTHGSARSSRIGDDTVITAGAKVIGNLTVGAGATIGANAVVLHDVPAGWVAVGVPARLIAPADARSSAKSYVSHN
jgi:serine O-acetyltransferase